jgi:hypothetical protein
MGHALRFGSLAWAFSLALLGCVDSGGDVPSSNAATLYETLKADFALTDGTALARHLEPVDCDARKPHCFDETDLQCTPRYFACNFIARSSYTATLSLHLRNQIPVTVIADITPIGIAPDSLFAALSTVFDAVVEPYGREATFASWRRSAKPTSYDLTLALHHDYSPPLMTITYYLER